VKSGFYSLAIYWIMNTVGVTWQI